MTLGLTDGENMEFERILTIMREGDGGVARVRSALRQAMEERRHILFLSSHGKLTVHQGEYPALRFKKHPFPSHCKFVPFDVRAGKREPFILACSEVVGDGTVAGEGAVDILPREFRLLEGSAIGGLILHLSNVLNRGEVEKFDPEAVEELPEGWGMW